MKYASEVLIWHCDDVAAIDLNDFRLKRIHFSHTT